MIESINSIYRPLFTVKFLHAGYETPKENFFSEGISIIPDMETTSLFTDYKMDYRFFNNTLICFIQCALFNPPSTEPKVLSFKIDGNIKIRFLLKNSSDFLAKTYVTATGSKKVYQFSNRINNTGGGNIFLTAPVENHVTAKDYDTGTIVQDGGDLYTSLKSVKAADNIVITNNNFWRQVEPVEQVANNADLQDAATVNADKNCFAVIDM